MIASLNGETIGGLATIGSLILALGTVIGSKLGPRLKAYRERRELDDEIADAFRGHPGDPLRGEPPQKPLLVQMKELSQVVANLGSRQQEDHDLFVEHVRVHP